MVGSHAQAGSWLLGVGVLALACAEPRLDASQRRAVNILQQESSVSLESELRKASSMFCVRQDVPDSVCYVQVQCKNGEYAHMFSAQGPQLLARKASGSISVVINNGGDMSAYVAAADWRGLSADDVGSAIQSANRIDGAPLQYTLLARAYLACRTDQHEYVDRK